MDEPVGRVRNGPDWLFHVSHANELEASEIDEHIWFPVPFLNQPDDYLGVRAWLYNVQVNEHAVSPEIIAYYTSH